MQSMEKKEGSVATFGNDDGKSQNIDTMLDFNALNYEMEPDLSVVTERTYKEHPFQKSSYSFGETAFCILNSGADFIDGRNSYLSFTVDCEQAQPLASTGIDLTTEQLGAPYFNKLGGIMDFIASITITDRAGNEVERIRDVGRLSNMLLRNSYSADWFRSYGHQLGMRASNFTDVNMNLDGSRFPVRYYTDLIGPPTADGSAAASKGYVIPLRYLCGLFDYNQLLPMQLMSGLKIEIQFAQRENALQQQTDTGGLQRADFVFTLKDCRIVADSVKLTDSIAREINERAANDGLEIQFRTWWTTQYSQPQSASSYNVEVRKAVSRAFGAVAHFGDNHTAEADKLGHDHNETHRYDFREWQWRAGNLYFPHQRLKNRQGALLPVFTGVTPTSAVTERNGLQSGGAESWMHMQRLFGKNHEKYSENDLHPTMYYPTDEHTTDDTFIADGTDSQARLPQQYWKVNGEYRTGGGVRDSGGSAYALLPLDLERSTVQDLSGIPLNNSRVLALDFELEESAPGNVTIWLQHLKIARVFMDNTEIEE